MGGADVGARRLFVLLSLLFRQPKQKGELARQFPFTFNLSGLIEFRFFSIGRCFLFVVKF